MGSQTLRFGIGKIGWVARFYAQERRSSIYAFAFPDSPWLGFLRNSHPACHIEARARSFKRGVDNILLSSRPRYLAVLDGYARHCN